MPSSGSPEPPRPRLHLDYVDGIRAVAALIVFFNHAYGQVWNRFYGYAPTGILAPAEYSLIAGHLSVTVFIVVSGFCLALPAIDHGDQLRGGIKDFLKRRARRILPPYYAALVLCLLLIATVIGEPTGSIWDVPIQVDKVAIISHLLLLQDFFATGRINYVFWSIAVEWQIYFAMPIFLWGFRRFGAVGVAFAVMLLGYAITITLADTRVARAHPHFLGMFTLGMLAAYIVRSPASFFPRLRERIPFGALAALAFATTVALIGHFGIGLALGRFALLDLPVGIMAAALLVHCAHPKRSVVTRVFAYPPLVFVGTFSYSIYLMHAPIIQLVWKYGLLPLGLERDAQFVALMTVGLVVALALSYVFHLLFEAPFMGRPSAAATAPVRS